MNKSILAIAVASLTTHASLSLAGQQVDETMVVFARSDNVNSISDIPANVVVISRDDIESSGAKSLSALLKGRAGIQVSDSNSGATFSLRGFSGEQASSNTLILLDGRRLNSQDLVAPNLNFIQLDEIEAIEILSGSAGVLYGDQAVGGVINIVTRSSKEDRVILNASYGSFNSVNAAASASGSVNDNVSYRLSATTDSSDNYRRHNESKNSSMLGRVNYSDDTKLLFLELGYYDTERQYAGSLTEEQYKADPTQVNPWNSKDYNHEKTFVARVGYDQSLSDNWKIKNELMFDDTKDKGLAWGTDKEVVSGQLFLSAQLEGQLEAKHGYSNLIFGIDAANNEYKYESSFTNRDNEQHTVDLYSQFKYSLVHDLVLTLGGRYARVEDSLVDQLLYPTPEIIEDDATAYEVSLNYQINAKSRVYIRTESNFRFAKVSEQSYTAPGTIGLKPQTGLSNELGWHWMDSSYSVRIDLFNLKLKDEIVFVSDPSLTPIGGGFSGANINADASTRNGASFSGDYLITDEIAFLAEYNYVNAEFTEGNNRGKDVAWVANHTGKLGLNYYLDESWNLYTDAVFTGERYQDGDNGNELDKLDAYWLVNLAVNYNYDDLTLSLRADNLLNEKYASYVFYDGWSSGYYPGSERAYYLSASYLF